MRANVAAREQMRMRIDDPNRPNDLTPVAGSSSVQPAPRAANSGTIQIAPDRADLSSVAGRLSEMLQPNAARSQQVCQLRDAVASDTYQVDAAAVSHRLVEKALSAKPRQP